MSQFNQKIQEFFDDFWWSFKVKVWDATIDFFRNIWWFFRNIHVFRKDLWNFRNWDSEYCMKFFASTLEQLRDCLLYYGHEVEGMRYKKISAIEELIYLIEHDPEDDEVLQDKYLGNYDYNKKHTKAEEKVHRKALLNYMKELGEMEEARLNRIFRIIKGQTTKELDCKAEIKKYQHEHPDLAKQSAWDGYADMFEEKFDGTGYKGWWD